jgi:hypothetical protein
MAIFFGRMPNLSKEEWGDVVNNIEIKPYKKKTLWQRFRRVDGVILSCDVALMLIGIGLLPSEYALSGVILALWAMFEMKAQFSPY